MFSLYSWMSQYEALYLSIIVYASVRKVTLLNVRFVWSPRTLRSRKQHSSSSSMFLSPIPAATPRKELSFSAVSTPVNSSSFQESNIASDASLLTSIYDQSNLRQHTITTTTTMTSVDGLRGQFIYISSQMTHHVFAEFSSYIFN